MDIGTPDWTQLADAKFWGLMMAILAAAGMGYGFIVYIVKQWINGANEVSKHKTEQIAKLALDANFLQETTLKIMQDNTHALTSIDKTVEHMARIVEQCPQRKDNANEYPD